MAMSENCAVPAETILFFSTVNFKMDYLSNIYIGMLKMPGYYIVKCNDH